MRMDAFLADDRASQLYRSSSADVDVNKRFRGYHSAPSNNAVRITDCDDSHREQADNQEKEQHKSGKKRLSLGRSRSHCQTRQSYRNHTPSSQKSLSSHEKQDIIAEMATGEEMTQPENNISLDQTLMQEPRDGGVETPLVSQVREAVVTIADANVDEYEDGHNTSITDGNICQSRALMRAHESPDPSLRIAANESGFSFFRDDASIPEGESTDDDIATSFSDSSLSTTSSTHSEKHFSESSSIPDPDFPEILYNLTLSLIPPTNIPPLVSLLRFYPHQLLQCVWAFILCHHASLHRKVEMHAIDTDAYWRMQGSAFTMVLSRIEHSLMHVSQVEATVQLLVRLASANGGVLAKRIEVNLQPETRRLHYASGVLNAVNGRLNDNSGNASIPESSISGKNNSSGSFPENSIPSSSFSESDEELKPAMDTIATHLNTLQLLLARTNRHMKDSLLVDLVATLSQLKRALGRHASGFSSKVRKLMKSLREQREKARSSWAAYKRSWTAVTTKRAKWIDEVS